MGSEDALSTRAKKMLQSAVLRLLHGMVGRKPLPTATCRTGGRKSSASPQTEKNQGIKSMSNLSKLALVNYLCNTLLIGGLRE